MVPFIFNPLAIVMSLSTATGVLLHDMHLDKATVTVMSTPAMVTNYDPGNKTISLSGDPHVHTERSSLSQGLRELRLQQPRIQPRSGEDKKHLMQKLVRRGHHAFDSYHIPLD